MCKYVLKKTNCFRQERLTRSLCGWNIAKTRSAREKNAMSKSQYEV